MCVEDGAHWAYLTPGAFAVGQVQGVGEVLENTGLRQAQEPAVTGGPRRKIQSQVPLGTASAQYQLNIVQDHSQWPAPRTTVAGGGGAISAHSVSVRLIS